MERLTKRLSNGEVMHNCGKCPKVKEKDFCSEKNCAAVILNRLAELEDKIESGRLVELPCGVGDTVYTTLFAASWQVQRIDIYRDKILIRLGNEGTDDYCCVNAKDFGTDWFFTKDEAVKAEEARLKELRGGAK